MQGGIIQQGRELGSVGHGERLKVKPFSRPPLVKIDHSPNIAAGQPPAWKPESRQVSAVAGYELYDALILYRVGSSVR
jgi:hypothetical protein